MKRIFGILVVVFVLAFCAMHVIAQEHAATPQASASQEHQAASQHGATPENPNAGVGEQLAEESKEAAGEGGEHAEFKESASVKWFARITHLSIKTAYWVAIALNFVILAAILYFIFKSSIPAALRNRSASIQKNIEEARRASEEANAKLREVEARLARLDTEVAGLKTSAEADFAVEEQRIKRSAEEDARRVVSMAEQEIGAALKTARRELTAYAADLAVDLAGKKIQVSESDDRALVDRFVSQLRKDGQ